MAIAGKVSIVPRGTWQSTEVYTRLDLVTYNRNAYLSLKESTGIEPTNTEYWMLLIENVSNTEIENLQDQIDDIVLGSTSVGNASSLGNETAEQWQTKLDNIQTTSRATLSQAGWYRVAEYEGNNAQLGGSSNGCFIQISNFYSNQNSESHLIQLLSTYTKQVFNNFGSQSTYTTRLFDKIRYTYDENKAYIEVHYSIDASNVVFFKINSGDSLDSWQAITPTLTSETIEGVTVTATYDIPANASPVTDLDLVRFKGTETLNTSILEKAIELPTGIYNYKLGGSSYIDTDLGDLPYGVYMEATIIKREVSTITVILWGLNHDGISYMPRINFYDGNIWHGWNEFATTADLTTALAGYLPLANNQGFHNSIFRGKNLGTAVTDEQWNAIEAGTFEDLYIGDYWLINGVTYRIAAFDYYYNTGDTACTTHHIVIVPDANMYIAQMHNTESGGYEPGNEANTTVGGYVGSDMYTTNLNRAKTIIKEAFGESHILKHRQLLSNAVTNGYVSGGSWYDSEIELMTEQNVYGGKIFSNILNGVNMPYSYTIDKSQYPLFALAPYLQSNRQWYWLRDVVSASLFANVNGYGLAHYFSASDASGVRPAFSIC